MREHAPSSASCPQPGAVIPGTSPPPLSFAAAVLRPCSCVRRERSGGLDQRSKSTPIVAREDIPLSAPLPHSRVPASYESRDGGGGGLDQIQKCVREGEDAPCSTSPRPLCNIRMAIRERHDRWYDMVDGWWLPVVVTNDNTG